MDIQESNLKSKLIYLTNQHEQLTEIILGDIYNSEYFMNPNQKCNHIHAVESLLNTYIKNEESNKLFANQMIMSTINIVNQLYQDNSLNQKERSIVEGLIYRTVYQFTNKVITNTFLDQINAAFKHNKNNQEHHKYLIESWDQITRTEKQDQTLAYEIDNPIGITELFSQFGIFQLEAKGVPQELIYIGITKIPQYLSTHNQKLLEEIQYQMPHRIKERIYNNNFDLQKVKHEEQEFLLSKQPL